MNIDKIKKETLDSDFGKTKHTQSTGRVPF